MDLGAYCQIGNFERIMKENNIDVPRLRGLRLMKNEKRISKEKLDKYAMDIGLEECVDLIEKRFDMNSWCFENSAGINKMKKKYIIFKDKKPVGIRWKNIHGKKRKMFKYVMKKAAREYRNQMEKFNSYVGRNDVLYIHARLGGGNWGYYHSYVDHRPWFIEKIDDSYDSTYCDIYARIKPVE